MNNEAAVALALEKGGGWKSNSFRNYGREVFPPPKKKLAHEHSGVSAVLTSDCVRVVRVTRRRRGRVVSPPVRGRGGLAAAAAAAAAAGRRRGRRQGVPEAERGGAALEK